MPVKKFIFRYASILKQYEKEEEAVKNELAKVQKRYHSLFEEKKACLRLEKDFESAFSKKLSTGVTAGDFSFYENGKKHYSQKKESIDQKIANVKLEIARIKNLVIEAMKKRKTMEKLREKRYAVFLEEQQMAENKMIEEIVNYKSFQKGERS